MKRAIVIGTQPDRTEQLSNCLKSIDSEYPVYVIDCDGYEIAKIKLASSLFDEFVFLQDTVEIKNNDLFKMCFDNPKSVSICNYPGLFGCYLGKYKSEIIKQLKTPDTLTKAQSVDLESYLGQLYSVFEQPVQLFAMKNTDHFIDKWGHKVMVIENEYLIKYKSCWNRSMI
jgi:hypothetical protein